MSLFEYIRHCERNKVKRSNPLFFILDCRVALLLAMTVISFSGVGCDRPSKQEMIQQGQQLYMNHGCAVCHGKEGYGDGITAKMYHPPPINLHDKSAYTRGSSISAIEKTIKYGLGERKPMPAYDHLTKEELRAMAEYLVSLQSK